MNQIDPFSTSARVIKTTSRLNLSHAAGAAYFGVPVFTFRKWLNGERAPVAAVNRLLDILEMVEVLVPSAHDTLLADARSHDK